MSTITASKTESGLTSSTSFRKSILLVEDNQDWQELFTHILLRTDDFEVMCASNLRQARHLIKSATVPFHIAVIDANLDEADDDNQDGFQLLEELTSSKYPACSIMVDHHRDAIDRLKYAMELKAVDYFEKIPPNKPFDQNKFMAAVRKAVELTGVVDVFVAMPFHPKYRSFYDSAVQTPLEELGYSCKRSDDIFSHGIIMEDILRYIRHAKFIVADLTENNLNVLFEVGLALAIQKPVVNLARRIDNVSNLIQDNFQVFEYGISLSGMDKLSKHLAEAAEKIRIGHQAALFEDPAPAPEDGFCLGLVPKYRIKNNDAYTHIIQYVVESEMKLTVKRMDDVNGPGTGIRNGWESINRAHIILSDLTGQDHRVYYWSGVAYGLGKKMVTLAKKGEVIPFDLRGVHRIEYQMGFAAGSDARKKLKEIMTQLLQVKPESKKKKAPIRKARSGSQRAEKKPSSSKAGRQQPVDVVILTVLEEEYQAVCRQLQDLQTLPGTETNPSMYAWKTGTVYSDVYDSAYRVVVGMTGRAGNPQSTMAVLEAVALWDPRYILFSGIAGGLINFKKAAQDPNFKPDIHLGDIVIADVIHGYEYGKVETDFNPRDDWTYPTDIGLLTKAIAYKANPAWRKRIKLSPPRKHRPTILDGQIASGDKVVDDPSNAFFVSVYRRWPKTKAVEMEGAGVGAAVNQARDRGKRVGFLMVRGISDIPRPPKSIELFKNWEKERGTEERDNWKPYAAEVAAAYTVGLIAEGLPVPPKEKN